MRLLPVVLVLTACAPRSSTATPPDGAMATVEVPEGHRAAVFAGGCFWCMEKPFDHVDGVVSTTSGYTGGEIPNPTYEMVSRHLTQHLEAIHVVYDPDSVTYDELLHVYWRNVDPTQADGQFCDRGHQYTTAIFVDGPDERARAEASKRAVAERLGQPVVTEIRDATTFWPAEDYHQDYYLKNPAHYSRYRLGCGRDARLIELWGAEAGGALPARPTNDDAGGRGHAGPSSVDRR